MANPAKKEDNLVVINGGAAVDLATIDPETVKWNREVIVDMTALDNLNWVELEAMNTAVSQNRNVRAGAETLAKITKRLPEGFGDPTKVETWLKLPRRLLYPLLEHIANEISGKN